MKFFQSCLLLLCAVVGLTQAAVVQPTLKGSTVLNEPFVMKKDGGSGYQGYSADLMNLIAEKAGFTFSLALSPDGFYGRVAENGIINGMLGEVNQKRADFAIADITVTSQRSEFVDFSEPIMESTLGAILKTEHLPEGATKMKDLLKAPSSKLLALQWGATSAAFQNGSSTLAQDFWKRLNGSSSTGGFVKNSPEGLEQVKSSATLTAFISQMSSLEYVAARACPAGSLTTLVDDAHLGDNQYAIALQKGSQWLAPINQAIKELKAAGKLAELKNKYWAGTCASSSE